MLYDRHLMQPLFKLSIGHPGSSFAVEIARKIGLPEEVIAEASEKVGSDYIDMDKYLQDIVRDKRYWENKRQHIRRQEKRLEELTTRYEKDLDTLNRQRKEIVQTAKNEAQQIIHEANAKIEQTIRKIKEAQAEKERTRIARQALSEFKETVFQTQEDDASITRKMEKLRERQARRKQPKAVTEPKVMPAPEEKKPAVGDAVRLKGQTTTGTVSELQDKQAIVAFGMIKSTVKTDRLEQVSRSQLKKEVRNHTFVSAQTADTMREKKLHFKQEIDVRGMRGNEALQAVTYFVDDAIQIGVSRVRILHGTGNGILRQLIRQYLSTVPGIQRFQDEHIQFGGAGITVIDLE